MCDGKIVGATVGMRIVWTFVVNLEMWNKMDLGTHPRIYDELFDRIEERIRTDVLDETSLFEYHGTSPFERLFNLIAIGFMDKCQREKRMISLSDETLLHRLSRLEGVCPNLEAHDAKNMTGDGLIFKRGLSGIVSTNILKVVVKRKGKAGCQWAK